MAPGRKAKGFTQTYIDGLPFATNKPQDTYFDPTRKGFGLLVSATTKTFIVQVRIKGRTNTSGRSLEVKKTIGRFGKQDADGLVCLDTALERYNLILADAEKGTTPAEREQMNAEQAEQNRRGKERQRQEDQAKDISLRTLLEEYITVKKKLKASTADYYRNTFAWYAPEWLDIPARSITKDMVIEQHAEIGKRSHAMANGTMKSLRAVLNYAIERYDEVFTVNPVRKLSTLGAWFQIDARTTFIDPTDMATAFQAILDMKNPMFRLATFYMIFTGARKGETFSLVWKALNFKNNTVLMRYTKNGKPLHVPIGSWLADAFLEYKASHYTGEDGFVFPSFGKTGHIVDQRNAYEADIENTTGIKFTPHDLRRTALTYLKNIKTDVYTRKRLVNHAVPDDITEGYTQHTMDSLREEVEKLAEYILRLATPTTDNIVDLNEERQKRLAA